ncbi:MAG: rhomboid family intramembrane serine protease [Candidatus Hermodarchaeota archaeon]
MIIFESSQIIFAVFSFGFDDVFYLLVQINYNIIYDLEIWRLLTSMFLHGDILHLFSNMLSLLIFGAYVELNYSKYQFILIYFISGLIGSFFSMLLLPLFTISLGASGAIFGLIGAAFSILITQRDTPLIVVGLVYVLYFIFSSFAPQINYFAHIFGLLGGMIIGFLLKFKKKSVVRF